MKKNKNENRRSQRDEIKASVFSFQHVTAIPTSAAAHVLKPQSPGTGSSFPFPLHRLLAFRELSATEAAVRRDTQKTAC